MLVACRTPELVAEVTKLKTDTALQLWHWTVRFSVSQPR